MDKIINIHNYNNKQKYIAISFNFEKFNITDKIHLKLKYYNYYLKQFQIFGADNIKSWKKI